MKKEFILKYNPNAKIKKSLSMYDLEYQIARSKYEADSRNWTIRYETPYFNVINSDDEEQHVFRANAGYKYEYDCTCREFIENESGTCIHIEAVKNIPMRYLTEINTELRRINNYTYVDSFARKLITVGTQKYITKSASLYKTEYDKPTLDYHEIGEINDDIFFKYGITLRDYQVKSVTDMIYFKKTILCLKVGLGKTLCALAAATTLNKEKILIICPNNLKYQWKNEIERFELGSYLIIDSAKDLKKRNDQKFLILSYEMLNHNPSIADEEFDILIADEIQKIKNPDSVSWKSMSTIKSEFTFTLSGTPIQNHITDILSVINFLNPNEFKPLWKFYYQYCNYSKAKVLGLKNSMIPQFRERIDRYIINPKIASSHEMPTENQHYMVCTLDDDSRKEHNYYLDMARPLLAKAFTAPLSFDEKARLNRYLTMARIASTDSRLINTANNKSNRFESIENKILDLTRDGKKVVVFSEWIKATDLLHEFLEESGIDYVEFNSKLPSKKKDYNLNKFIHDENCMVFLSTDSGGTGIDGLQYAAHNMIHIEKAWNPFKLKQRNGRLVRSLQENHEVDIWNFYCESEIESMIEDSNVRKNILVNDVMSFI